MVHYCWTAFSLLSRGHSHTCSALGNAVKWF